jgi:hypothetical protein
MILPLVLLALTSAALVGCTPPPAVRTVAYGVTGSDSTMTGADSLVTGSDSMVTTAGVAVEATQMVALRVPSMHCPFACWPKVKKTLEGQGGVAEVTLAKQKSESELTNPVVYVQADDSFDSSEAIEALAAVGFQDAVTE